MTPAMAALAEAAALETARLYARTVPEWTDGMGAGTAPCTEQQLADFDQVAEQRGPRLRAVS